ncbi:MAG: peptidylprolyl isomerase [Gemmatimonadota bacterium]|nr:MAG: peptidylprolyl isomerase [Gemmatimonadota bacterium]
MEKAKRGDTVKVQYTGRLQDGRVFDTSAEREPLRFTIGQGNVIRGFEQAVVGMAPGEAKSVHLPPEEAYGVRRDQLVFEVQRAKLPSGLEPEVGKRLEYRQRDGTALPLTVTAVSESKVTLDANHPLAGHELTFDIELLEIVATP